MKKLHILAATLASAAMLPATAAQFDFYKLTSPTIAADFLPSDGVACTNGDLCSSDVDGGTRNGDLTFSDSGITAMATGTYQGNEAAVVQDHENGWSATESAGLGVYHKTGDNSDDNITMEEKLTVSFDQVVNLTRIELRSEGHNFNSWAAGATFMLNGVQTLLPQGTGFIALDLTGTSFSFAFDDASKTGDQFYLSAMSVTAVPEPETLALMLAGLGAMALLRSRRRTEA